MERSIPEIPGVAVEHDFVDAGGLRMHVATAGPADAEPLLLLHGWPQHFYAWRRLIGPLSQRYRVICPDLRGFGWTDAPSGGYEKRALAADVVALLDALGLDRVRLAGHDWGGFVGFLLCLEAPERISHFAVAGMSHLWVRPERGIKGALKQVRRLSYMALLAAPLSASRSCGAASRGWSLRRARSIRAHLDRRRDERVRGSVEEPARAAATVGIYRSFLTRDPRARVRRLPRRDHASRGPLLRRDRRPPRCARRLRGQRPRMRIEVVEDAGHWLPEEAPETLLEGCSSSTSGRPEVVRRLMVPTPARWGVIRGRSRLASLRTGREGSRRCRDRLRAARGARRTFKFWTWPSRASDRARSRSSAAASCRSSYWTAARNHGRAGSPRGPASRPAQAEPTLALERQVLAQQVAADHVHRDADRAVADVVAVAGQLRIAGEHPAVGRLRRRCRRSRPASPRCRRRGRRRR